MKSKNLEQQEWLDGTVAKLTAKMHAVCVRNMDIIPYFPHEGHYMDCTRIMPDGTAWWTNGFWPGLLWQMHHATGEECYQKAARAAEDRIAEALVEFNKLHHDVGFLFLPSAVANWKETGNETGRTRGLHAATLLAGRFNPTGNFIRAWNEGAWLKEDVSGCMIIDSLLNLPLLYWASETTGDPRFADIANRHAETSLTTILREDGSCGHIADFDAAAGRYLGELGGQGYGEGSSWSRGQSWAVYGYALAYRHTGRQEFLDAAKRCAHYCISNLAVAGWLPLVDFRTPAEPVKYDSGAGMILACGFLEIARHVPDLEKALYEKAVLHTLQACDAEFADWNPDTDGIMGGGTTMYHDGRLANKAFIYNDYFFAEAILKLAGKDLQIW